MDKFGLLFVLGSIIGFCAGQYDTCSNTYRTMTHCLSQGPVRLSCPSEHWIFISHAVVYKSRGPTGQCPYSHDNTACRVGDIQDWIQSQGGCALKNTCTYNVPYMDDSHCASGVYQGAQYLQIHYQCQAVFSCSGGGQARAMSIDQARYAWTGSMAQIDSYPTALLGNFVEQTSSVCCIKLPPRTQMTIKPGVFIKNPDQPSGSCQQRIEVTDSSGKESPYWMCDESQKPMRHWGCYDEEKWFTVKYVSSDVTVGVVFALQVEVDHDKSFTMECGLQAHQCQAPPPTPTYPTPSPTPTQPPKKKSNMMNIVIGVVVAALLLLLLILVLVCCSCRRRDAEQVIIEEDSSIPSSMHSGGIAVVKGMVMDDGTKSDLYLMNTGAPEPMYGGATIGQMPYGTSMLSYQ